VLLALNPLLQRWLGYNETLPIMGRDIELESLRGAGAALGVCQEIVVEVTRESKMIFVALARFRKVLGSSRLAGLAAIAIWTAIWGSGIGGDPPSLVISWILLTTTVATVIFAALRFGLFALIVGYVTFSLLFSFPVRPDVGTWYATVTLMPLLGVTSILTVGLVAISGLRLRQELLRRGV
jgi:hypothetical protein